MNNKNVVNRYISYINVDTVYAHYNSVKSMGYRATEARSLIR